MHPAPSPTIPRPPLVVTPPRADQPAPAPLSLSASLEQLQGQAAFAPRTIFDPPQLAQPYSEPQPGPGPPPRVADLVVDGLDHRRLFVRLPESDPVHLLLEHYVPPEQRPRRDLSGDYRDRTLDDLVSTHNWRGVARFAYDQVTQSPPNDTAHILTHWVLRFHALLRLRLVAALSAELSAVTSLLPPAHFPPSTSSSSAPPAFHPDVPFELHLLSASLPSLAPAPHDAMPDQAAAVERLAALLQAAKGEMWHCRTVGDEQGEREWRERVERVGEVLSGVLGDLKAHGAQRALLASSTSPTDALLAALARHHYSTGDLASLATTSATSTTSTSQGRGVRKARVLELVGRAQWDEAERELRGLVRDDEEDLEAQINLAVVLLYSPKLDEAISHLHTLLRSSSPSLSLAAHHSPTLLFNLCTLYELRSERATEDKVRLLVAAASCGGGAQGVEASSFKLAL
ncbi:uncharacterized protein RHOBADRAFT_54312 [Rhodotorula graminis WP1]|uniref:Trafficking protein particle complex subunit 12 n=1 Tax=Rhodotorula graminis (strain WP1) TaxID=578459 RepID=A0A194S1U1_RHOGW|nr:uncharacterized protein RHOBADRAFT_54312 [Rhodotorula graminis WP1]KPV74500.1 hypothetical protein RHOBADRAFT_54312 [Rhodotorula graminis WP1]